MKINYSPFLRDSLKHWVREKQISVLKALNGNYNPTEEELDDALQVDMEESYKEWQNEIALGIPPDPVIQYRPFYGLIHDVVEPDELEKILKEDKS